MAAKYTYEQFKKAAQDAGLYDSFSDSDLKLATSNPDAGMSLLQYKKDYQGATTDAARLLANEGANSVRKEYGGYTGGSDGSGYYVNGGKPAGYTSEYGDKIKELLDTVMNREDFSYDAESDPTYQNYRKAYTREGQRATQDVLGAASALTGGLPSTAAVTAAAQQGNYYAAQLADKIPELEQQAYDRYVDRYSMDVQNLGLLREQDELDYGRYTDQLNMESQQRQEALEKALYAAQYGDYSGLEELGVDVSDADWDRKYQMAVLAAEHGDYSGLKELGINIGSTVSGSGYSSGTSGSSSSSSSTSNDGESTSNDDELTQGDVDELLKLFPSKTMTQSEWNALIAAGISAENLRDAGFSVKSGTPAAKTDGDTIRSLFEKKRSANGSLSTKD